MHRVGEQVRPDLQGPPLQKHHNRSGRLQAAVLLAGQAAHVLALLPPPADSRHAHKPACNGSAALPRPAPPAPATGLLQAAPVAPQACAPPRPAAPPAPGRPRATLRSSLWSGAPTPATPRSRCGCRCRRPAMLRWALWCWAGPTCPARMTTSASGKFSSCLRLHLLISQSLPASN